MTSNFTFPKRFLTAPLLAEICSYYNIEPSRSILDRAVHDNNFLKSNFEDCVAALAEERGSISSDNGMLHFSEHNHYEYEEIGFLVDHCRAMKIPYDSINGCRMNIHFYRPGLPTEYIMRPYHENFDCIALSSNKILDILEMNIPPDKLAEVLLLNIKEDVFPVPLIHTYRYEKNKDFSPTGLKDIVLLK